MSKTIQIYPLQPKQLEFANAFAKFRLYGGAKGGGKSYAMRAEATRQANSANNIRGLMLRRTFPEIEENTITPMRKELPLHMYEYNASKGIMTFNDTSSTIRFSYCRNLKDVLNYQGVEYDFIGIEELTHWTFEEWSMLMTSLRTNRKGITPNFFASTNPGGIGHAWVKRLFIDRDFKPEESPEDYAFIPASVYDNYALMESQPEYIQSLKNLPDIKRRAYLDGDWDVFEGQYFKEFRRPIHVIEPTIPRDVKRRIVALDYGYTNPSAAYWMSLNYDSTVTIYRELYQTGLTYKQLAIKIKALTPADEEIDFVLVDPSIVNKKNEATGTSGSDEMMSAGLKIYAADNAREKGWMIVRQFLRHYVEPNFGTKTAKLKITSNCSNLIRTIPIMLHDEKNVEDLDTKLEDHAVDAIRYGLVELYSNVGSFEDVSAHNSAMERDTQKEALETKYPGMCKKAAYRERPTSILDTNF